MWGFVFAEVCAKKNNEGISSEGRWISCSPYPVQENRQQPNGRGLAARRHPSSHPASYIYRYKARPAKKGTGGDARGEEIHGGIGNVDGVGILREETYIKDAAAAAPRPIRRREAAASAREDDSEAAQSWPARRDSGVATTPSSPSFFSLTLF